MLALLLSFLDINDEDTDVTYLFDSFQDQVPAGISLQNN